MCRDLDGPAAEAAFFVVRTVEDAGPYMRLLRRGGDPPPEGDQWSPLLTPGGVVG